jgi:hypothetical protein
MNKEKFHRYAELKCQVNALTEEMEELKGDLLSEMKAASVDKVDHDLGTFTVSARKNWKFSEKVESMKEAVKVAEADEKADGTATFEETPFVMFKEKKIV